MTSPARRPSPQAIRPQTILAAGLGLVLLLSALLVIYLRTTVPPRAPSPLSAADNALYGRLLATASDHVERGAVLLELGLRDEALDEFSSALVAFESSRLRDNPWVRPRMAQLEATVRTIYAGEAGASGLADLSGFLRPAKSVNQFAAAVLEVENRFIRRYGRGLDVTGRDHIEHVALYGPGSAVDIRTYDLSPLQVQFLSDEFRREGLRVKDFSNDAVLQMQVLAALRAGHPERAGTGLHLHVDRFTDRVDAWTVGRKAVRR